MNYDMSITPNAAAVKPLAPTLPDETFDEICRDRERLFGIAARAIRQLAALEQAAMAFLDAIPTTSCNAAQLEARQDLSALLSAESHQAHSGSKSA